MNSKILFSFLMAMNIGFTFLNIPTGLHILMDLYGVTYAGIAVLMSALLWSHALMQIPAGMIADRLGVRGSFFIGLTCLILGNLIPAASPDFYLALSGRIIVGFGTALSFVTSMKLVALYSPGDRIGTYQSFFAGVFSMGNILAYLFIPKPLVFGWQWIYLLPGVSSLVLFVIWFGFHTEHKASITQAPLSLIRVAGIRAGWILGFYHALSWGFALLAPLALGALLLGRPILKRDCTKDSCSREY